MKYGFIYLWYDSLKRKFCLGSHYGSADDGYVTSTGYMIKAYKKRPKDFKRRILFKITEDCPKHKKLYEKEQYFLNMIKDHELGKKYYNYKKIARGGNDNKGKALTDDHKAAIAASLSGKKMPEETKNKISQKLKGKSRSKESIDKQRETSSKRESGKWKKRTPEHSAKIIEGKRKNGTLYGHKKTEEEIARRIETGKKNGSYTCTEERKLKMVETRKQNGSYKDYQPKVTCPHCGMTSSKNIMSRWHFEKCKKIKY
jgi:hypothetical protein